jgi:phosphoglycerol transferase MdoB-like AlkP superfamily enzyme
MANIPSGSIRSLLLLWFLLVSVPVVLRWVASRRKSVLRRAEVESGLSLLQQGTLILQELFLAGQCLLGIALGLALLNEPIWAAIFSALCVGFYHWFMVSDFVLVTQLGLRMSGHFLSYLRCLPVFSESLRKVGVPIWWLAGLALFHWGLVSALLWASYQNSGVPALTLDLLSTVLVLALLTGFSGWNWPVRATIYLWNPAYLFQLNWFKSLPRQKRRPTATVQNLNLIAANERSVPVRDEAPLFRCTESYAGELNFELILPPAETPHVIFLFLESFTARTIGAIHENTGASPEFDRYAKEGVLFTRCYGNGVQTARAVMSSLFGIPPRFTPKPAQSDLKRCPRLTGVPQLFESLGYQNAYFHNGSLEFENQDSFFRRNGFRQLHGMMEMARRFPDAKSVGGWGVPDEFLMRYFVEWLERQSNEGPSFSTLFTMTNHHPFELPSGFAAPVYSFPGNPEKELFLRTFFYTDYCFGLLMRMLRERGLDRKCILFVLADTAQPLGEHDNWTEQENLFEENLHIPLLVLAPAYLKKPCVISEPCSQLDLLPTLIDLFRRPFCHHAIGRSLLRKSMPAPIAFNNPFGPRSMGERLGDEKLLHEVLTGRTQLFNLALDPNEQRNLAEADPERTRAWLDQMLSRHELIQQLYAENRFC